MSLITTHVLDTATGRPAAGVPVRLERAGAAGWAEIGSASTDRDGRVREIGPSTVGPGTYRLVFDTRAYVHAQQPGSSPEQAFFPEVSITFTVRDQARTYHVPLLISPFSFSAYLGS
jgi:5-hydroxyisourate hydrolase